MGQARERWEKRDRGRGAVQDRRERKKKGGGREGREKESESYYAYCK